MMLVRVSDWAWLPLDEYPSDSLTRLKDELTIQPRRTSEHQEDIPPIELYCDEFDGVIGIPRGFFFARSCKSHDVSMEVSLGRPIKTNFAGKLREDQEEARAVVIEEQLNGRLGGLVQAKPGYGKTVVALSIFASMGVNAIVVVHKQFLLDQWVERIKQFIPSARIGRIQKDKCEFGKGYDISVAMIQSLVKRRMSYPSELWSDFGLAIYDECHRVSSPTWSAVAPLFTAKYRLGLSATPRRLDGTEDVFFNHIGPIVYKSRVKRVVPKLRRIFTGFKLVRTPRFDPNRVSKEIQLRFLCKSPERNNLIVDELSKAVNVGRKVIVLSERLKHLDLLREKFEEIKPDGCVVDYYVGGRTKEELRKAEGADVLLCTYQMTKEGLDIPSLDTMFLTTPISDVEQSVGRIMREYDGKKEPVVTDFIDENVTRFARSWNSRRRFYIKEKMFKEGSK
jgi:superfamily II DNA or RNA helicase